MCLLVKQPATAPALSDDWLSDFFSYNADGVGVMYSENDTLIIEKALPKDAQSFIEFYRAHIQGRDCAFHLRMKTHGNIDLENCHPYEVLNREEHGLDLWLMHNGILTTGNDADITKSDTWHYIRNYLRPMLVNCPEFAFHPSFADIVGAHIGDSNKFILTDNTGRMAVINEGAGVWWGGLWLSNTYAWSASKSATSKPIDCQKTALEQSCEKPVKHSYSALSTYPAYYDYTTRDQQFADDCDGLLYEIERVGLRKAGRIDLNKVLKFADEFGEDATLDLLYMVKDAEIDEGQFIKILTDYDYAQEVWPWLSECKADYQYAELTEGAYQ